MNEKTKLLLVKISIPVLIIGGCLGIDRMFNGKAEETYEKPVIVCSDSASVSAADDKPLEIADKRSYGDVQGLSENLGFIGKNEALVGIGLSRNEFYKKYPKAPSKSNNMSEKEKEYENNAYGDIYGNIYKLNLSTLEKKPLNIETRNLYSDVVPNVYKLNYIKNNQYGIYDLKNNSNIFYKRTSKSEGSENTGNWSKDGRYLISYNNGNLDLYNTKEKSTKQLKIKSDNLWISMMPSYYSENGEEIYFIGEQPKDKNLRYQRQGIFKINSKSGKIDQILALPYRDSQEGDYTKYSGIPSNDYSVLDDGKKILFNATIEGKDGAYIYDTENKKFYDVIPHTIKSKEGSYGSPMWISPDKTKIVYMNRAFENNKEQWNLYVAKINGDSFISKICLEKNIELSDNSVQWSGDSKKILYFTGKSVLKNGFVLQDKNQINIVTFK